MRTVICILLILTALVAHARGGGCYTTECKESNLWLLYFLGFVPVAIFAAAKRDAKQGVKTKLNVALVAPSFVASIVAAIAFLGIAHSLTGNDISIALRMFIAGIISYAVFWLCIVKFGKP